MSILGIFFLSLSFSLSLFLKKISLALDLILALFVGIHEIVSFPPNAMYLKRLPSRSIRDGYKFRRY